MRRAYHTDLAAQVLPLFIKAFAAVLSTVVPVRGNREQVVQAADHAEVEGFPQVKSSKPSLTLSPLTDIDL